MPFTYLNKEVKVNTFPLGRRKNKILPAYFCFQRSCHRRRLMRLDGQSSIYEIRDFCYNQFNFMLLSLKAEAKEKDL